MREKIYLFLLAFSIVILVYLYKFQSKNYFAQQEEIQALERVNEKLNEENKKLKLDITDALYFSLKGNDKALSYFEENIGIEASDVQVKVEDYFLNQNTTADNPSVPYVGMEGIMKVNKVRILNHKWLVADFTDGVYWGEMLYEYFITEQDDLELELLSSFLYTN